MKLLVRNLSRSTTEAELRELFESYGRVQYCTLVLDQATGSSKGFGFVEMPRPGDAKAAVKNLNNKEVAGHRIRVKKAQTAEAETGPVEPAKPEVAQPAAEKQKTHKPARRHDQVKNAENSRPQKKKPEAKKKPVNNPWLRNK